MTDQTPTTVGAEEAPASFPNPYPLKFPIEAGGAKTESVTVRVESERSSTGVDRPRICTATLTLFFS